LPGRRRGRQAQSAAIAAAPAALDEAGRTRLQEQGGADGIGAGDVALGVAQGRFGGFAGNAAFGLGAADAMAANTVRQIETPTSIVASISTSAQTRAAPR
jgi:hypothetical protein